jgi:hypothetical protein
MPELPTRRVDLSGRDLDGAILTLSFALSKKLYRCPGCGAYIPVGSEHVVVRRGLEGAGHHEHWHRACAGELLTNMRDVRSHPAGRGKPSRS